MFRLLALLLLVAISIISVAAVHYNKISYLIDFNIVQFSQVPLGMSLFIAMIVGILISTFFLLGIIFSIKKKHKALKKDHELISKEVQNLRRIPIQE